MSQPYIGQIILVGFNFAPPGWAFCFGQFLPISEYDALFALIGTTYGGDGETTFALPDLRSRVPVHMGQGPGLQNYILGEFGGVEQVTITSAQMAQHAHAIDGSSLTATLRCRSGAGNQLTPVGNVPAADPNPAFTDASLAVGLTPVRAVHINELRVRVDLLRASAGLQPYAWTDPVLTAGATIVKAQHLIDLRTALTQACAAGGYSAPVYAEPIAAGSTIIKASHITELRNVLRLTPYSNAAPDSTMAAGTIQLGGGVGLAQAGGSQPHNNLQPYLAMNYLIALFGIFPPQN
jgi:microcystin-dependent protein